MWLAAKVMVVRYHILTVLVVVFILLIQKELVMRIAYCFPLIFSTLRIILMTI